MNGGNVRDSVPIPMYAKGTDVSLESGCLNLNSPKNRPGDKISRASSLSSGTGNTSREVRGEKGKGRRSIKNKLSNQLSL